MSDSDFERAFNGSAPAVRPSFTERVGKTNALGEAPVVVEDPEAGRYRAFGFLPSGNVGETCEVSRWIAGTEVAEGLDFQYRFLTRVGFIGQEEIRLFLPDCIVVVIGKRLLDLRKKLARRQVTFIQQYSARVWPVAPPNGEAVIDSIEIAKPERM